MTLHQPGVNADWCEPARFYKHVRSIIISKPRIN